MTDRWLAFTVILEDGIPAEQAERVREAIGMMYFVQQVRPWVADHQTAVIREQERAAMRQRLFEALEDQL